DSNDGTSLTGLCKRTAYTNRCWLVSAENTLEVSIGCQNVCCLVQSGCHLRLRVEWTNDLKLGVCFDVIGEATYASDFRASTSNIRHHSNLAFGAYALNQGLSGHFTSLLVVGRQERLI